MMQLQNITKEEEDLLKKPLLNLKMTKTKKKK